MAAIFILFGGILGFATAVASMLVIQTGLMLALAIWCAVGLGFLVLGLAVSLLPRPGPTARIQGDILAEARADRRIETRQSQSA